MGSMGGYWRIIRPGGCALSPDRLAFSPIRAAWQAAASFSALSVDAYWFTPLWIGEADLTWRIDALIRPR